ncbi:hypothetical protein D3C73_1337050 [compost metagenome]
MDESYATVPWIPHLSSDGIMWPSLTRVKLIFSAWFMLSRMELTRASTSLPVAGPAAKAHEACMTPSAIRLTACLKCFTG